MASSTPASRPQSASVIAELAREAQLGQLSAIDSLDTKAATLMGFAGVFLGLSFSSETARTHWNMGFRSRWDSLRRHSCSRLAILPRHCKFNPNIAALERFYLTSSPETTQAVAVESIIRAISSNSNTLRSKVWLVQVGTALIVAGLVYASVRFLCSLS